MGDRLGESFTRERSTTRLCPRYVSHDTGLEKSEVSAPKNDYKGTVETVKEEDEEDEE